VGRRISLDRSCCQETTSGDGNRLGTLFSVSVVPSGAYSWSISPIQPMHTPSIVTSNGDNIMRRTQIIKFLINEFLVLTSLQKHTFSKTS
jgi:hypothetical protein